MTDLRLPPPPQFQFGQLNITGNAGKQTLFFNRVPKVGSQSTMQLLKRLSYRNRFNFHKDLPQKVELINLKPPQEVRGSDVPLLDTSDGRPGCRQLVRGILDNFTSILRQYLDLTILNYYVEVRIKTNAQIWHNYQGLLIRSKSGSVKLR